MKRRIIVNGVAGEPARVSNEHAVLGQTSIAELLVDGLVRRKHLRSLRDDEIFNINLQGLNPNDALIAVIKIESYINPIEAQPSQRPTAPEPSIPVPSPAPSPAPEPAASPAPAKRKGPVIPPFSRPEVRAKAAATRAARIAEKEAMKAAELAYAKAQAEARYGAIPPLESPASPSADQIPTAVAGQAAAQVQEVTVPISNAARLVQQEPATAPVNVPMKTYTTTADAIREVLARARAANAKTLDQTPLQNESPARRGRPRKSW